MRSLAAMPAALLALLAAHAHTYPITSSEASSAITRQIHKQVAARLRGAHSSETLCSGRAPGQQEFSQTTELDRWRCTLELRGSRFPSPCKAEAYVSGTHQAHRVRIEWLAMNGFCDERPR